MIQKTILRTSVGFIVVGIESQLYIGTAFKRSGGMIAFSLALGPFYAIVAFEV